MSGKSKEEVAFELVSKLKGVGVWGENNMKEILNMYAECLEATSGLRIVNEKAPSALRLRGQTAVQAQPTPAMAQPAPMQAAPMQQQPHATAPQLRQTQPVAQPAFQQQIVQPR